MDGEYQGIVFFDNGLHFSENEGEKMKINVKNIFTGLITAALFINAFPFFNVSAEYGENALNEIKPSDLIETSVDLNLKTATVENGKPIFKNGSLILGDETGSATLSTEIGQSAVYNIEMEWKPISTGVNAEFGLMVDDKYPEPGMEKIVLSRIWKNASDKPTLDSFGNEYAPEQEEKGGYLSEILLGKDGTSVDPFSIRLNEGKHEIRLIGFNQAIEVKRITLCKPEEIETYSDASANYKTVKGKAGIIYLQGEDADEKTSNTIIPKSDNSDSGMTPSDPYKQKINCIGGTSWQSPGEKLKWNFNVEESGYYRLVMRYKQSDLINGNSLRMLRIDEKIPFAEAKEIAFPYTTGWKYYNFGDENGNAYYIPLEKGEHTISLEATIGSQYMFVKRLSEITDKLSEQYISIVMLTGETPDVNTDYELFNQIPDFEKNLIECRDGLLKLSSDMKKSSGKNMTQCVASMENMTRVIGNMLRNKYSAQQYLSDYYSNYTSLSAWLNDMLKMPLYLDEIQLVPYGKESVCKNVGLIGKISFGFRKFLASFSGDYTNDNSDDNSEGISLWVNWGQDQAAALNSIISDSFTQETGIKVNVKIVNASLINGILSDNFPDVALQMARTEPVNLGIRGALADLTQFDDYQSVLERFQPGAEEPYSYGKALYALPDTQEFMIMFYRTDIFKNLGLTVPNTWEEFQYATTVIQRNNMNVYVPYTQMASTATVNTGIGSLNIFPTLLNQRGISLYNESKDASVISSDRVVEVIKEWTSLYMDSNILKEADFYNRIRLGAMPLGIASYSTYMTLYSTAPEIKGKWAIALVPGTYNEDGTLNRAVAGYGTGCSIIEKSNKKKYAWEFLKWWTNAVTQKRYNNSVESILGTVGRIKTSNKEAFNSLSWNSKDLEILNRQWENVKEIPEIPGSYYLVRSVDQMFWEIVNNESNIKNAAVKWEKIANAEIDRKVRQYCGEE